MRLCTPWIRINGTALARTVLLPNDRKGAHYVGSVR